MAITKDPGRQYPVVAMISTTFADLTSGSAVAAIDIPAGAWIISGTYYLTTAFNSLTSDAVVIQDNAGTPVEFLTDADATTAVTTAFTIPAGGYHTTTAQTVDIKWTGAGTAPTTGAITLAVEYVLDDRANEVQPV